MNKFIQTEDTSFARDTHSMALVNTNKLALNKYKEEKRKAQEFQQLKNEVSEMKLMLANILEKLNGR